MLTIERNPDQERVLRETLERKLRELELEILHTDHHDFKAASKERQRALESVAEKLGAPVAA